MGVISLLGQEQAYEIERLLQVNLEPKEYESRRIQCGTASQFQGDERDIIFLSVVEGPSEKGGPVRLLSEDGKNDMTRKRYNVAASRAKDQMWVVHSLNPEMDLKPDDIRLKLIKHAINPSIDRNKERLNTAESDFEKRVMQTLLNQGYKVIPQWKVGAYRIDMVIEDGDKRVALECDGEKWHTQDDLPNDLKRQAILERLGWKFIRIRGSVFYRNPEETMDWVFSELDSHGISPNFITNEESPETEGSISNEIFNRINRRAEQIRREWHVEVIKNEINNEVNDEIVENIQDVIDLIETEKSDSNDRDVVNATLEEQTLLSLKDKNVKTMTIASEKVNAATETSPKAKKVTSLNPSQKSKCRIINENENNKSSTDNPMFDFRKDHARSKNKKQVTNTKSPKEKMDENELKNLENNEKKNIQKPLFDFRKK